MAQQFTVLSAAKGPLEGGGQYLYLWLQPMEWEDRAAPHITRGPVPFKIGAEESVVDEILKSGLPAVFDLDVGVKVASGNKSQGHVFKAVPVEPSKSAFIPADKKAVNG